MSAIDTIRMYTGDDIDPAMRDAVLELDERLKALEDMAVHVEYIRIPAPEPQPAPPDDEALLEHYVGRISDAYHESIDADEEPESLKDILREFARKIIEEVLRD